MSYEIEYTGKIKKDIKLAKKRGLDFSLFKDEEIKLISLTRTGSHSDLF